MKEASQRPDDMLGDKEMPLTCRAEDQGWNGYITCLEDSREGRACGYNLPFGQIFLCDNPVRIEQMRSGKQDR